jgi:long-subunit acyl-CoA synthetase (AMP-forming)
MRPLLGRRIVSISSGGAPTSSDVKQFLISVWGENIVSEGYACTEAGQLAGKLDEIVLF